MDKDRQYTNFALVGVGRSGTSLLMSMLNAHPQISLPPETHFVDQYIIAKPWKNAAALISELLTDHRFARLGFTQADLVEITQRIDRQVRPSTFYLEMLNTYAERTGVTVIGDKAPKNLEYLPVLNKLLDHGLVIHIIRDPRDVYLSRTKAAWSADRSDLSHLVAYRSQYGLARYFGSRLFGDRYIEIKYEDLILQPEVELTKICLLLDLPFDSRMLDYQKSSQRLVSSEEMEWKKETLQPLISDNMDKWKDELSEESIALIENVCYQPFREGFYEKHSKGVDFKSIFPTVLYGVLSTFYQGWVIFKNWKAIIAIPRD